MFIKSKMGSAHFFQENYNVFHASPFECIVIHEYTHISFKICKNIGYILILMVSIDTNIEWALLTVTHHMQPIFH